VENLLEILEETPWWIYALFAYLLVTGYLSSKPRRISFSRILVLPAILVGWSLHHLLRHPDLPAMGLWALFIAVGIPLGWHLVRSWRVQGDQGHCTIHLPGSWTPLSLSLIFFAIKYFSGYFHATHTSIPWALQATDASLSGFISGILIGRVLNIWNKYTE
jgi:hypothetical protein